MRRIIMICLMLFLFAGNAWTQQNAPQTTSQPDPNCKIKGIIGPGGTKLYLTPEHYLYDGININAEKGEMWLCSEDDALKAGFTYVPDPKKPRAPTPIPTPEPPPTPVPEDIPTPTAEPDVAAQPTETPAAEAAAPSNDTAAQPQPANPPESAPENTPAPKAAGTKRPAKSVPQSSEIPKMNMMTLLLQLLPQLMVSLLVSLGFMVFMIVMMWIVFKKAGRPGWGILIPLYNIYLMLKIGGMSGWWLLGLFIPFVNIVAGLVVAFLLPIKIAGKFGKGVLFGIGLIFIPFIFYAILALTDVQYSE